MKAKFLKFVQALYASGDRQNGIHAMKNDELANALLNKIWADMNIGSEKSDLVDEAIVRLRAAQQPTPAEDANASPVDEVTVWECDRCKFPYNALTAIACAACGAIRQPKAPAPHGR